MTNQYSLETIKAHYLPLNGPVAWLIGEVERLRDEREAADSLIAKLYGENERLKDENEQLQKDLAAREKHEFDLWLQNDGLKEQIAELRAALEGLRDVSRLYLMDDHPAVVAADKLLSQPGA